MHKQTTLMEFSGLFLKKKIERETHWEGQERLQREGGSDQNTLYPCTEASMGLL